MLIKKLLSCILIAKENNGKFPGPIKPYAYIPLLCLFGHHFYNKNKF